jgi:nicotinamide-nucleotide amidase
MIEIIAIGNEILLGQTLNTNVHFLSQQLKSLGYVVSRHTTLPDEPDPIREELSEALKRSSLVITTGGLGPTCDDLTRQIAAELFHSDFRYDESIAEDLRRRYGDNLRSLKDQATVPTKAEVLFNRVGTAPGLIFEKKLILLPGVPQEMQALFLEQVVPFLQRHHPAPQRAMTTLHFCLLIENQLDPILRELRQKHTEVSVGIYPGYGTVTIHLFGPTSKSLQPFLTALQEQFGTYLFPSSTGKIEEAIHEAFLSRKLTLALAESCTGGTMASHLTSLSGASQYFLGSFVVYSNALKQKILSVSEKTLQEKGAVSREAVTEMFEGLFNITTADFGIAVSGIAGPLGGTQEKPVGTIWAALGRRGEAPDIWTFRAKGNRETIILKTSNSLLGALWRKIAYGIRGGE